MTIDVVFYCPGDLFRAGGGATVAYNILLKYPFTNKDALCVSSWVQLPVEIESRVRVIRLRTPKNRLMFELYNQFFAPLFLYRLSPNRVICLDSIIPLLYRGSIDTFFQMRMFYFEELDTFQKKIKNFIGKLSIRLADTVFVASEDHKRDLVEHLMEDPSKFKVAYLGVDHGRIEQIPRLETDERFFLFVSILRPYKNLHRLIEAYISLSQEADLSVLPNLRIIGDSTPYKGQENYLIRLQDRIRETNLEEKVIFMGKRPFDEVVSNLKASIALVFPTLFEGFGLPLLEAMAAGVPVITSDRNSLPEIGGDQVLYINPEDDDSIKNALKRVLDGGYSNDMVSRAHARAQTFKWENTVRVLATKGE